MEGISKMSLSEFKIQGLTSPPVTAFKDDGELNTDIIPQYVQHLVDFGISNVFVTGTTGEGLQCTLEERKAVAEAWITHGRGRLDKIIIHIGAGNLKDSQELASHAEAKGADAISCVGTSYYKPETMASYVAYMAAVARAAPKTPFLLYDIDFLTGINFDTTTFFTEAKSHISTLVGVKHTSPNLVSIHNVLNTHPDMQLMMGSDDMHLEGLSIGARLDIVNSYAGNALNRVRAAFDRGDMESARKEQTMVLKVRSIRNKYGLSIAGGTKAILRTLGLEVGQPRLPLVECSQQTLDALKKDLTDIGFYEWAPRK